ncbi:MAG: hypothetical protein WBF06_02950 [Candidatus Acidiferrales bacterium]
MSAVAALAFAAALPAPPSARAQDKPTMHVEDNVAVFAYGPDGRIAYSVEHDFRVKKAHYRHDDVWIVTPQGSKRHLIDGEKFVQGTTPFNYKVDALSWSADGKQLAIQLTTDKMSDAKGNAIPPIETLLMDDSGREITVSGGDSLVPTATDAQWLFNNTTVAYLADPAPPAVVRSITELVPATGKTTTPYPDRGFAAVNWNAQSGGAVAISTTSARHASAHLVAVDLPHNSIRELAPIDGYVGGLTVSPSRHLAAYFIDPEVLEVRDIRDPRRVGRAHIAFGKYCWSADETRILLKRGDEQHPADLVWVTLPPLAVTPPGQDPPMTEPDPRPIFHDLEFPNFAISPDGNSIAVVQFGRGWLLVYPLPE